MKSFEDGPSPEQIKSEEEMPSELPKEEVLEVRERAEEPELKPEQALTQERSVLERFKGKAKQVAGVLLFVSALSAGPGMVSEAYAQETKPATRTEQVQKQEKQEEKINETNLTESSKWSRSVVESARADMKKIKTAEDAEWLIRTHFNQLVSEYYMPTKGNLKEGPYGIKTRDYTEDDSKLLLRNAQEMKKVIQELNTKFGIEALDKRMEQVDDMIKKLERQSSYSGQKQKEALERMEKLLQQR
ncbi:MAG: hypothetical protein AAB350_00880 [Patescibacteria group bacterium]